MVTSTRSRRMKAGPHIMDSPGDPLAATKLDYALNLVAAGVLRPGKHRLADVAIVRSLLAPLNSPRNGAKPALSERTAAMRLRALASKLPCRRREPRAPGEPLAGNVATVTRMLGLDQPSRRVLEFAYACYDKDLRELLEPVACPTHQELLAAVAAATGLAPDQVGPALSREGRLRKSGLLSLYDRNEIFERLELDHRLVDLLESERLLPATVMERFIPAAAPPTLTADDFAHLGQSPSLARQILATALANRRAGTNLLLAGPTGTGKTELARLIAQQLGVTLFVTGREDDDGHSPNTYERLSSFLLGNRLLATTRALLMFDEMEDLFTGNPRNRRGHEGRMSKQWFNHLLETNAVPTIWIANETEDVDPAFLRRFTFAVQMGATTASQRRRAWTKYLGEHERLPAEELERLVHRFEVGPAQIATAVNAARLAAGEGRVSAPLLESVTGPLASIVAGRPTRPRRLDPGTFLPEVLNTKLDLAGLTERLRIWDRERAAGAAGLSLCLYGPPGTGKSAYVGYLARRLDRPLLIRRPSDLLGAYVGETEQSLARAFDEALRDGAVLLLDEVDTFLQDRRQASRTWEVSQVNELLQQLDDFRGIVACTTNLFRDLDQASLRRFSFKIAFDYLVPAQAVRLLRATLDRLRGELEPVASPRWEDDLERAVVDVRAMAGLTPGDYATVARRMRVTAEALSPVRFVEELEEELRVKSGAHHVVGFAVR